MQRESTQSSGGTGGACDGAFTIDFASSWAAHASSLGQPFSAGDVIDLQAWFRDPAAPATTNLAAALES